MNIQQAQANAYQTIDCLLNRGANILYDAYITEKLPSHTAERANPEIFSTMQTAYRPSNTQPTRPRQKQPNALQRDSLISNKIQVRKQVPSSAVTIKFNKIKSSSIQQTTDREIRSHTSLGNRKKVKFTNKKSKPFVPLHYYKTVADPQDPQLLKQLISRRAEQKKAIKKEEDIVQQIQRKKLSVAENYRELKKKGPINYNYEGRIFTGKKSKSVNPAKHRNDDFIEMDYMATESIWEKVSRDGLCTQLSGRKRGYTSSQRRRKVKISDKEFNNGDMRQITSIPFVTIQNGSKITEKQKDVVVEKANEFITKQEYQKEVEKNRFKSFTCAGLTIPVQGSLRCQEKHDDKNSTFSTFNKTASLFRTKAGPHKNGKIHINDEDLAKDMCFGVKDEEFLG